MANYRNMIRDFVISSGDALSDSIDVRGMQYLALMSVQSHAALTLYGAAVPDGATVTSGDFGNVIYGSDVSTGAVPAGSNRTATLLGYMPFTHMRVGLASACTAVMSFALVSKV